MIKVYFKVNTKDGFEIRTLLCDKLDVAIDNSCVICSKTVHYPSFKKTVITEIPISNYFDFERTNIK